MASIKKLEEELNELIESIDSADDEDKADFQDLIDKVKREIADAKKAEASKDKMKQQAEKKIDKLEKEVASPKTPTRVKAAVKKSITTVKKQVKEAVKEDMKERTAKRGRPPLKKAAASGAKRGRPAAKKAVPKKVVKRKTKAEVKYEKALGSLEKLVNRTKELKEKYKGQGVDLKKDAQVKAKPFGYRLRGDNYRRPTKAEIKSGEAYWEGRPNRADVKRSKYPKLEDGGMMDGTMMDEGMMAKGGRTKKRTKAEITADKRFKALKPGKRTSEDGNVYFESRVNRSDVSRRDRI